MDPYLHTALATAIIAIAFYWGRRAARMHERYVGANKLMEILDAEGTYPKEAITAAVERWVEERESE